MSIFEFDMSIFEFDTSISDGSGLIEEFCKDYNDEYNDDQFEITKCYLYELDQKNIKLNLMLDITNMKFYVLGYHIIASLLGLPNDLDINYSYQFKKLVEIENNKVYSIFCEANGKARADSGFDLEIKYADQIGNQYRQRFHIEKDKNMADKPKLTNYA